MSPNYDYDKAKILISTWFIIATLGCLITVHILMCMKETRERLGKLLKSFALIYSNSIIINDNKESSLLQLKDEEILFFFIERVAFPVILVVVVVITYFDIYLYRKYYLSLDKDISYLFPIPYIAQSVLGVNFLMSVATIIKMFYWDKVKAKLIEILNEQNGCSDTLKKCWDKLIKREEATLPSKQNKGQTQKNENKCKDELKQHCQKFLIFATLVLLFGIVYLFYHGFWIIIALLVYPQHVLVGYIFTVPLLMLVAIPIWNTIIKIAENWFDVCNESSCRISCSIYKCNWCIRWCWGIIYFFIRCCLVIIYPCIRCSKNNYEDYKNKCKWQSFCKGCVWLAILVYEIVFWGLFLHVLWYVSTFKYLISGNLINSEIKMYQLVFSYITISAVSGILTWFNTELVILLQNQENQDERQQDNEENQDEQ